MTRARDSGAILINALMIVLVISAVSAALLTRAEEARLRAGDAQDGAQLAAYLDAVEALVPTLLAEPLKEQVTHLDQAWAGRVFSYDIDRGRVTARLRDLQGGLNVNWLVDPEDEFLLATFTAVFDAVGVPPGLIGNIADFIAPNGPRRIGGYMARPVPLRPAGGPVTLLDELRQVEGMTAAYFAALEPVLTALPPDTRLNLNTAPDPVRRAMLAPFPTEIRARFAASGPEGPLTSLSTLRNAVIEILESEDLSHLPIERLGVGSLWFGAVLTADLDGQRRKRQIVVRHDPLEGGRTETAYRWALYD